MPDGSEHTVDVEKANKARLRGETD
jgi:hypothetical protein